MSTTAVDVINTLFSQLGMAVQVTAETLGEYWPLLVQRFAAYTITTSWVWMAVGILLAAFGIVIMVGDFKYDWTEGFLFGCGIFVVVLGVIIIICQALDIVTAYTFPEKLVIEYIKNLLSSK